MKKPIAEREQIVSSFVKREIGKDAAAQLLGCTKRTLETYSPRKTISPLL